MSGAGRSRGGEAGSYGAVAAGDVEEGRRPGADDGGEEATGIGSALPSTLRARRPTSVDGGGEEILRVVGGDVSAGGRGDAIALRVEEEDVEGEVSTMTRDEDGADAAAAAAEAGRGGGDDEGQPQEQQGNDNDEGQNQGGGDDVEGVDEDDLERTIATLTSNLRLLFTLLTLPLLPLGSTLILLLLFVLHAAVVTDARRPCGPSHPLHAYALCSLAFVLYAPRHGTVRRWLFRYDRRRDGPVRPRFVRLYDQMYHAVCVLYVYGGVALVQSCRDDVVTLVDPGVDVDVGVGGGGDATHPPPGDAAATAVAIERHKPMGRCELNCPDLYASTRAYVCALVLFAFVLLLPLLCLPCVYVWVLRRAAEASSTLAVHAGRLRRAGMGSGNEEDGDGWDGVTVRDVLRGLDRVRLYPSDSAGKNKKGEDDPGGGGGLHGLKPTRLVTRDCCICMMEFRVPVDEDGSVAVASDGGNIVEGKKRSAASSSPSDGPPSSSSLGVAAEAVNEDRTERETSPLLASVHDRAAAAAASVPREDQGAGRSGASAAASYGVRAPCCGQVFHASCLGAWIGGGRWESIGSGLDLFGMGGGGGGSGDTSDDNGNGSGAVDHDSDEDGARRRRHRRGRNARRERAGLSRRATRRTCPFCRGNLVQRSEAETGATPSTAATTTMAAE